MLPGVARFGSKTPNLASNPHLAPSPSENLLHSAVGPFEGGVTHASVYRR
jgi:hypothetical protein